MPGRARLKPEPPENSLRPPSWEPRRSFGRGKKEGEAEGRPGEKQGAHGLRACLRVGGGSGRGIGSPPEEGGCGSGPRAVGWTVGVKCSENLTGLSASSRACGTGCAGRALGTTRPPGLALLSGPCLDPAAGSPRQHSQSRGRAIGGVQRGRGLRGDPERAHPDF